jgi:hypothetical protein
MLRHVTCDRHAPGMRQAGQGLGYNYPRLIIETLYSFQFPALIRSLVVEIADRP